jgi:hypothetical protein
MRTLIEVVQDARDAGTPLLAVTTTDQQAAVSAICKASNGAPKLAWDAVRGIIPLNETAKTFCKSKWADDAQRAMETANPQTALEVAGRLPDDSQFFALNAHRFVQDAFFSTAVLALRDTNKLTGRTLILLGPAFDLPAELQQDVVVIDDPIPTDAALREKIAKLSSANGLAVPDDVLDRAVDATRGLSLFGCEQVTAMSLRKVGIDLDSLWERKRTQISQTKGLSLQRTGPSLDDIGGNAAICTYGRRVVAGKQPPRALYLVDEIEKYMAGSGSGGDSSGVSADYLGVLLREMEDNGHDGLICVSPPGCGKTMFARALAVSAKLPLLQFDFGAMKGRYVGDSEGAIRQAFKVANGVAAGRALVVATCNRLDSLPPELRRRFTNGIWYFDLPDAQERLAIWKLQIAAHGLSASPAGVTFDEGWTGAEIRNCCRIASRLDIPLAEAASYVVPVSQSDPNSIEALRTLAEGRFLSANRPGTYTRAIAPEGGERRVRRES